MENKYKYHWQGDLVYNNPPMQIPIYDDLQNTAHAGWKNTAIGKTAEIMAAVKEFQGKSTTRFALNDPKQMIEDMKKRTRR